MLILQIIANDSDVARITESSVRSYHRYPDDIFEFLSGIRQGGPESPPLYNLYMDYVMHTCEVEDIKFLKLNFRIRATATAS